MRTKKIHKKAFIEFSKIVMFFINYSKRKVYINHLKMMIMYYLIENRDTTLIDQVIKIEDIELDFFDDYLKLMLVSDYIELNNDVYGLNIIAKKKLEKKMYDKHQVQILEKIMEQTYEELQDKLGILLNSREQNRIEIKN